MTAAAEGRRSLAGRAAYLARIAVVYANRSAGPLSFWYERPEVNEQAFADGRAYFMRFRGKAAYRGPFDAAGVPLLDYRGDIGPQYNPIAIAQYGLARFNRWCDVGSPDDRVAWLAVADWLARELRPNASGVPVWAHHFDWPYRQTLLAPWYSGLAQGAGLSMLVRAARATADDRFGTAAHQAFESFRRDVSDGGVTVAGPDGDLWIEEYVVDPPSHILNGFMWALWGVYDYATWSDRREAHELFRRSTATLERHLPDYDTGWWSLYEARDGRTEMLASRYYHTLHITQLRVMQRLTGTPAFGDCAEAFQAYLDRPGNRARAFVRKVVFKLARY